MAINRFGICGLCFFQSALVSSKCYGGEGNRLTAPPDFHGKPVFDALRIQFLPKRGSQYEHGFALVKGISHLGLKVMGLAAFCL